MKKNEVNWQNKERIENLIEENPYLSVIMDMIMTRTAIFKTKQCILDRIGKSVKMHLGFERIDEQVLFSFADEYLYIKGAMGHLERKGKPYAFEDLDYYFIVNKDNLIISQVYERREGPLMIALESLSANEIKSVVKVHRLMLYEFDENQERGYGEELSEEWKITVFNSPKGNDGLQKLLDNATLCNDKVSLYSKDFEWSYTQVKDLPLYKDLSNRMAYLADRFTARVFARGMRQVLDEVRTLTGEFDGVTMRMLDMAGRMMFTLENERRANITFIADATSKWPNLGVNSYEGTFVELEEIVDVVCTAWHRHTDDVTQSTWGKNPTPIKLGSILQADQKVNFAGISISN